MFLPAMKPRNEGGVVDGRLNVYGNFSKMNNIAKADHHIRCTPGTQNLKCVDLSICPVRLFSLIRKQCSFASGQPRDEHLFVCPVGW